jgi:predicted nucleotide-binding protein
MARRTNPLPDPKIANLNAEQLQRGIERLTKRLDTVRKFDPRSLRRWDNPPELEALCADIDEALVRTFGPDTIEYRRYQSAAQYNFYPPFGDADRAKLLFNQASTFKDNSIGLLSKAIEGLKERLEKEGAAPAAPESTPTQPKERSKRVFIVHGQDDGPKHAVARFLTTIELEPIILHEQASGGRTIIEKIEEYDDVGFAVVLLTPDDEGRKKGEDKLNGRARQNVVLELGYFLAHLQRKHVVAMVKGNVEKPSDFSGVIYVPYDDHGAWKTALARELEGANYDLDWKLVGRA